MKQLTTTSGVSSWCDSVPHSALPWRRFPKDSTAFPAVVLRHSNFCSLCQAAALHVNLCPILCWHQSCAQRSSRGSSHQTATQDSSGAWGPQTPEVGSEASIFSETGQQPSANHNSPRQPHLDGIRDVSKALFELWLLTEAIFQQWPQQFGSPNYVTLAKINFQLREKMYVNCLDFRKKLDFVFPCARLSGFNRLSCGAWCLRFRVSGLGFRCYVQGFGFRVWGYEVFRAQGFGWTRSWPNSFRPNSAMTADDAAGVSSWCAVSTLCIAMGDVSPRIPQSCSS